MEIFGSDYEGKTATIRVLIKAGWTYGESDILMEGACNWTGEVILGKPHTYQYVIGSGRVGSAFTPGTRPDRPAHNLSLQLRRG